MTPFEVGGAAGSSSVAPQAAAGTRAPIGRSFAPNPEQSEEQASEKPPPASRPGPVSGPSGSQVIRPSGPQVINGLLIEGEGMHSPQPGEDLHSVDMFMGELRKSLFFMEKDGIELVKQPDPLSQAATFQFSLRLKLRNPIPLQ